MAKSVDDLLDDAEKYIEAHPKVALALIIGLGVFSVLAFLIGIQ